MELTEWITTIIGLLLIGGIAWFFWGPKKAGTKLEVNADGFQQAEILVKGGYTPDLIVVKKGMPVRFEFIREEKSSCSEIVVFPEFQKSVGLPFGKKVTVDLLPQKEGTFPFSCQMGMYKGTLVVKN